MNLSKNYFKRFFMVLKATGKGFLEHKILKISAALAYITMFSIGPLLLVILFLSDIFLGRAAIEGTIYGQIKKFVGPASAEQIQTIIQNLTLSNEGFTAGIIGVITLLFGATSVFAEIQDSINTIWGIQPKKKSGIWLFLKARLLSFGVITSIGFILLVSLALSTILEVLSDGFFSQFSESAVYFIYTANTIITFIIISLLFGSIFKILPDAKIKWRQVRLAAFVTALLFMLGKFLISFYIANSNLRDVYGTAGSFVILMVWVYYSSVILYFGAEFAKRYASEFELPIVPHDYAEAVQTIEVKSAV
jgi:membrane protein